MIKSILQKAWRIYWKSIGYIIKLLKLDKAVAAGVQFLIGLYIQHKMKKQMKQIQEIQK